MSLGQHQDELRRRVLELTERLLDGETTPSENDELGRLLADEAARRVYLEYTDQHARMLTEEPTTPARIVAERVTYERIELDADRVDSVIPVQPNELTSPHAIPTTRKQRLASRAGLGVLLLSVLALIVYLSFPRPSGEPVPGRLHHGMAMLANSDKELSPGANLPQNLPIRFVEDSLFETESGYRVEVRAPARLMLRGPASIVPADGSFTLEALAPLQAMRIHLPAATLSMRDGKLSLDAAPGTDSRLTVFDGEVTASPNRNSPRHYWSFDTVLDGRVNDYMGDVNGVIGANAKRAEGLVGPGALEFDNTSEAYVALGSGGGTALATGSFSMDDAVSIEALFTSNWGKKEGEERVKANREIIFRKDDDKKLLMLVQMKSLMEFPFADPELDYAGPAFAFGLYLIGAGYSELIVPMDGQDGRPTVEQVTDGSTHSIVATYNSRTGTKALYYDGRRIGSQSYRPGTRILSGGPGGAALGNMPVKRDEPFSGVIDEVAVYDYPLTSWVIEKHKERVRSGRNYFGKDPELLTLPEDRFIIGSGESVFIDRDSGLPDHGHE